MKYRKLGKTGMEVSEVSFGTWAIGSQWGQTDDSESLAALEKALELGVNFFDTADVYGMGKSEKLLAELKKRHKDDFFIATKAGRKLDPHTAEAYTVGNIRGFVEESLKNLQTDALDLLQLHCPPTDVYYNPDLFEGLDAMVREGKLKNYGVSVEKVEEALKAIEYPGVKTVQIIFNMFRQRPAELFFPEAAKRDIGIIVRVPLASGLLTGKMSKDSTFPDDDHRKFNRNGESFDKGETFAGVDFEKGLTATEELKKICPNDISLPQFALRWILMFDAVSCAIPGAKRPSQAEENVEAADYPELYSKTMEDVKRIYTTYIRGDVHHRW
jgi:aryl-alcohol dehydrogenase-like predicted oxidoreductase